MYLICHVTLQDHLIQGSCKFIGGSSLQYITMLASLMTIDIVIAEIKFLICHVTSRKHMFKEAT